MCLTSSNAHFRPSPVPALYRHSHLALVSIFIMLCTSSTVGESYCPSGVAYVVAPLNHTSSIPHRTCGEFCEQLNYYWQPGVELPGVPPGVPLGVPGVPLGVPGVPLGVPPGEPGEPALFFL